MKVLISKIKNIAKLLFTKDNFVSVIVILANSFKKSSLAKSIFSKDTLLKAIELAKELDAQKDISASEKANQFNLKLLVWAQDHKIELKDTAINCLRELAVVIAKSKTFKEVKDQIN